MSGAINILGYHPQRGGRNLGILTNFMDCMGDSDGFIGAKKCFLYLLIEKLDWIEEHEDEINGVFEFLGHLMNKKIDMKLKLRA